MFCEASCGVCDERSNKFGVGQKRHNEDPTHEKLIMERLDESIKYMDGVKRNRLYKNVRDYCLNKVPDCTLWAAQVREMFEFLVGDILIMTNFLSMLNRCAFLTKNETTG